MISTLNAETMSLAETIMNNLLGRQVDANYNVRMYCIRGLGNMADIKGSEVRGREGGREREGGGSQKVLSITGLKCP